MESEIFKKDVLEREQRKIKGNLETLDVKAGKRRKRKQEKEAKQPMGIEIYESGILKKG